MKTGKRWSSWTYLLLLAMFPLAGCATDRAFVEKSLLRSQTAVQGIAEHYRAGCPDVIDVTIADRSELSGRYTIGPDGRIELGEYGDLRVEGRTCDEIAKLIGDEIGTPPTGLEVRVVEHRSQHLLLFGEVSGWQRRVPYHGQETVVEALRRVGGITAGAEPKDVYVVRPHMGESQRPELIHVDLHAIIIKGDQRTNIRLHPFDQIYVGETRRAQIERAMPPWLRRAYHAVGLSKLDVPLIEPDNR